MCGGRSGAIWLPSHDPGGCCTLVVDEEISSFYVKHFERLEKRYINVRNNNNNYYYYYSAAGEFLLCVKMAEITFLMKSLYVNIEVFLLQWYLILKVFY